MSVRWRAAATILAALSATFLFAAPAFAARYAASVSFVSHGHGEIAGISSIGDEVSVTTARGRLLTRYSGPGNTTPKGLSGRLGRFGRVSLRFVPSGKPQVRHRPAKCSGLPGTTRYWKGTFVGSVRFTPENGPGFISHDRRFNGYLQTWPRWDCGQDLSPLPKFDSDAGGIDVTAISCDGRSFSVNEEVDPATPPSPDEPWAPVVYAASWTKRLGAVNVTYSVNAEGRPETAVFAAGLESATITPPPPFHGEARLDRAADGSWTWAGSLSARFPGRTVSLAGPEFKPVVWTYEPRPYTGFVFAIQSPCGTFP
jgi:hypothetical protein